MKKSISSSKTASSSSPCEQPRLMSFDEIAHNIAVLVVRQHHRLMAEEAEKNDSISLQYHEDE